MDLIYLERGLAKKAFKKAKCLFGKSSSSSPCSFFKSIQVWLWHFTVTWTWRNHIDAFYLKRDFSEFSHFCVTLLQCKPTVVVEQPQLFHPSIAHLKRLCPTTTQWLSWYYVLRWEFNRLFLKCSSLLIQAWFLPRFCHFKKSWLMHKAASQAGSKQSKKKAWRCQSPGCKP